MIPSQRILLVVAAVICACRAEEQSTSKDADSNNRKTRGLVSIGDANAFSYDSNVATLLNSYLQGETDLNNYQNLAGGSAIQGYYGGIDSSYYEQPDYSSYQYPVESIKRYAVKEDVDEGFVTTTRPVYLPRAQPRPPVPSNDGWRPILTNTPRTITGRSFYFQNVPQVQNQIHPQSSVKTTYVPVEKVVGVPVPEPYTVPVYQPYPVAVPQPYPVKVPLPVHVQSTVTVPVEKQVPVPVIKHVPYNVLKNEHVPVPVPYPVPVPLYKTKYVVHTKKK